MSAMTTILTFRRKGGHPTLEWLVQGARSEHGQATVEFACAAVVLFCFLIGIMQISRALYVYNFVSEAARQGTRYAMVRGSTSCTNTPSLSGCNTHTSAQIQTYVQGLGYPGMVSSNLTATLSYFTASASQPTTWSTCTGTCNLPGNLVKVVVSYPFPISVPFFNGNTFTVSSTSQMVVAQ